MSKMTLKTEGDTQLIVTRHFTAPPEAVYRAHTDPKLIQKWLLGPEGWTMPVCINEASQPIAAFIADFGLQLKGRSRMRRAAKVAALALASAIIPQILYAQASSVEPWIYQFGPGWRGCGLGRAAQSVFSC